jgi:hypothetical protein
MGEATVTGAYADLYSASWVSHLRHALASDRIALGLEDLDDSVPPTVDNLRTARVHILCE